jgi:hypothetical protein
MNPDPKNKPESFWDMDDQEIFSHNFRKGSSMTISHDAAFEVEAMDAPNLRKKQKGEKYESKRIFSSDGKAQGFPESYGVWHFFVTFPDGERKNLKVDFKW